MTNAHIFTAMIAILISTSSCSIDENKANAEHAVDHFHSQLDQEEYDEIYANADERFRSSGSKTDVLTALQTVHERLGNIQRSYQVGYKITFSRGGREINLAYKTDFENGAASEAFVWTVRDGRTALVRYQINSSLLTAH